MRTAILGALGAICLAACGGGGAEAPPLVQQAQTGSVAGTVYEVGGQTVDRSGVTVRLKETGAISMTGVDGGFSFRGLRAGTYTLEFDPGLNAFATLQGEEGERERGEDREEGDRHEDKDREEGDRHEDKDREEGDRHEDKDREEGDRDEDKDREEGDRHEDKDREEGDRDEGKDREETDCDDRKEGDREEGEREHEVDVPEGGDVELRIALARNGDVLEFSKGEKEERFAMEHLRRAEGTDIHAGGKVAVAQIGDRERIRICVRCLEPETVVTFWLGERESEPVLVGDAAADADGAACFLRDTGENQNLPLNAESLDELAGYRIEVRVGDETILFGEVPDLPRRDGEEGDGERDEKDDHDGDTRGKARLEALVDGVEGIVAIRCWPREELQDFLMVVEGLEPGDLVAFEIQDRELEDRWVKLGTREASEGGRAFYATGEGDPMPFGVESVRELVGLRVRVRRDEADDDTVLLVGRVPGLVED